MTPHDAAAILSDVDRIEGMTPYIFAEIARSIIDRLDCIDKYGE